MLSAFCGTIITMTVIAGDTYAERAIAGTLAGRNDSYSKSQYTQGTPGTPGVGALQANGTVFTPTAVGGAGAQNTTGFTILMWLRCGVAANPGQNGHIYLEVALNNNGAAVPTTGWKTVDYVAQRNNHAAGVGGAGTVAGDNTAMLGNGRGLHGAVPNNYWYRLRTQTIAGYSAPTYITDGATNWGYFVTLT